MYWARIRNSWFYDVACLQHRVPNSFHYFPICHTIAQAVSRRLPTTAARVRARVRSCGICGRQSGTRAGFLRVLQFPPPIFIPPIAPQSPSSIIWGWYNRPEVAAVPSGFSLTPLIIIIVSYVKVDLWENRDTGCDVFFCVAHETLEPF
jgi:hypothetical protein